MTMKRQKTLHRFAAVAAVLLTLCLVFMMPAAAETTQEFTPVSSLAEIQSLITNAENQYNSGDKNSVVPVSVKLSGTITNKTSDSDSYFLVTVPVGVSLTLDLNGNQINIEDDVTSSNAGFINVIGSLSIIDSGNNGAITVTLTVTKATKLSCVIQCRGKSGSGDVTVSSGKLVHTATDSNYAIAGTVVDVNTTEGESTLTVTGAAVLESEDYGIRAFVNHATYPANIIVNGGSISSTSKTSPTIWIHQSGANVYPYSLNIGDSAQIEAKGGAAAIGIAVQGNGQTDSTITREISISGGTITGTPTDNYHPGLIAYFNSWYGSSSTNDMSNHKLTISGGNFIVNGGATKDTIGFYDATKSLPDITITGGSFTDPTVLNYLGENADVTVTLSEDVTLDKRVNIVNGNKVTLNLNGKTITGPNSDSNLAFFVSTGTTEKPFEFIVDGKTTNSKIKDGTIALSNGVIKATIDGGSYEATKPEVPALQTNGNSGNHYEVTVKDAVLSSEQDIAVYLPGKGTYSFEDSKITGTTGIYMKAGVLTVTGGEITATGAYAEPKPNGSGASSTGDGIILDSKEGYQGDMVLTLTSDVRVSSTNGYAIHEALTDLTKTETVRLSIDSGEYTGSKGAITASNAFMTAVSGGLATVSITGGTFSSDVSEYVAEGCICIQEDKSKFVVQDKSENTVVPDVPATSETTEVDGETTTTITPNSGSTVDEKTENGVTTVTIAPSTDSESAVTITIEGANVKKESDGKVTVPEDATITAEYKKASAETDEISTQDEAVTFTLSVNIDNVTKPLPVIDATMLTEEKKNKVKDESGKQIKKFLAAITALGDNDNNGVNENLDGTDAVTIVINVHKSLVDNPHLMAALHLDKDGNPKQGSNPKLTWKVDGEYYVVTIIGKDFSSYVLVEEEPQDNLGVGGSGKDTGSGNYQYYPRDVPTNGIVDFGTSKVVTGMELPAGSSGKVTLNIKPTFAMPENGFYAFEIDAPGYNLDAKINGGLSFQIPVADLEAAGWTAKDIVLYHGTVAEDGKITWEALPTNLVKNEAGIAYYKSAINGCSPFYIGFVKDGSVVNTEVVDPVTPPTETPDVPDTPEVLPPVDDPVDEPETPEQPTESPAPILAVLAGLGAAVVLRRK